MQPDEVIDAVGLYCPMPILLTTQKIKELKIGDVLEVIADDEGIVKDMPTWCKSTGNQFLKIEKKEDQFHVFVKKMKD
ncbi:MAG: sulfurtransferase TusA family protein [Candidatus Schekmanbacteria bacterium]|nr:sulfurtransferase TusA family protein [Candidatus Schekmanbacteria bacterium]